MSAEVVLYNGSIRTLDPARPIVEALVVRRERVLAIGSSEDMLSLVGPKATHIDLGGRLVIPGFQDAHVHLCSHGLTLQRLDLNGALSLEVALERVRARADARRLAASEWILGRGWNHNLWPNAVQPTRHDLDRVAALNPVALWSKDGHAMWANSGALCTAGIDATTPDPPGGRVLRDAAGEPIGILLERAQELVSRCLPDPAPSEMLAAARASLAEAARLGVTSAHNCEGSQSFSAFRRLAQMGDLTLRI